MAALFRTKASSGIVNVCKMIRHPTVAVIYTQDSLSFYGFETVI